MRSMQSDSSYLFISFPVSIRIRFDDNFPHFSYKPYCGCPLELAASTVRKMPGVVGSLHNKLQLLPQAMHGFTTRCHGRQQIARCGAHVANQLHLLLTTSSQTTLLMTTMSNLIWLQAFHHTEPTLTYINLH